MPIRVHVQGACMSKSATLSTGVHLEYVEQGDRDGTPVVFVHGVTDSWRSFGTRAAAAAIVCSRRGHLAAWAWRINASPLRIPAVGSLRRSRSVPRHGRCKWLAALDDFRNWFQLGLVPWIGDS